jgi:hypothetical protein
VPPLEQIHDIAADIRMIYASFPLLSAVHSRMHAHLSSRSPGDKLRNTSQRNSSTYTRLRRGEKLLYRTPFVCYACLPALSLSFSLFLSLPLFLSFTLAL